MANILIVEDDESLADTIKQWLVFQQHHPEIAGTGYDALEQLRFSQFDVILMDWQLPEMTGIDICKQYRAEGGNTPILMMSGNDSNAEKQTGLQAGANDYLKKPFKLKELSERINKLLPTAS